MGRPSDLKFRVVDDFSTMRRIVRGLLKEMGCTHCEQAEDGSAALHMLRSQKFDFVVSDINMPNMNGFELLRAIKADDAHTVEQTLVPKFARALVPQRQPPANAR